MKDEEITEKNFLEELESSFEISKEESNSN